MASPEVPEGSSSEACSGGYEDLVDLLQEEREEEELEGVFEQAAKHVQKLAHVASTDQLLYLYARFKQVKVGKCNTSKPGFFDYEGKKKWEAWKALGDCTKEQAMSDYIEAVKKLDPDWTPQELVEPEEEHKTSFGGPVVSCLFHMQEILRDEDKDVFDYCRDNDISRISQLLATGAIDVNVADDEGRSLLHWACDRGRTELVNLLLFHNAHINMQDSEGQTPLHYASACEFTDIVDILLEHGADPCIKDNDRFQPHEVTDSKEISNMLKQHATFGEHTKPPGLL